MRTVAAARNPYQYGCNQGKGDEREKRNGDKTEPVDVLLCTRYTHTADAGGAEVGHFLLEVVKERDRPAQNR